jgi:hypothetical protein
LFASNRATIYFTLNFENKNQEKPVYAGKGPTLVNNTARLVGFLILCLGGVLCAQTRISGDISDRVFDSTNNPIIVEKDIAIGLHGKTVFNEGCVLLFTPFSGLNVNGSLFINGTQEHPVVFTTINDSLSIRKTDQAANPFDWNGIFIDRTADTVVLNNVRIRYSVYGVKSQKKDIVMKNADFKSNGQFNFTIFDKIQYVQDNFLYSYPGESAPAEPGFSAPDRGTYSIPPDAELYINKKPGKRVVPDASTPARLKFPHDSTLILTLFKKGYADTTFSIDVRSNGTNGRDITMNPLSQTQTGVQNRFVRDRYHALLGRYCFISSPVFVIAGACFLYLSGKNYHNADNAQYFLKNTILPPTDAKVTAAQQEFSDETSSGNAKRNASIVFFSLGTLALGAGFCLYF